MTGLDGEQGAQGIRGIRGEQGIRGGRGRSGVDWTGLAAYVLLAAAFVWTTQENRVQAQQIGEQKAALELCVNGLRSDLRASLLDFENRHERAIRRALLRLEDQQC